MDTIWQTLLFRLAEHAQWIVPILIATGVLGLGPSGARLHVVLVAATLSVRNSTPCASRWLNCRSGRITTNGHWELCGGASHASPAYRLHVRRRVVR